MECGYPAAVSKGERGKMQRDTSYVQTHGKLQWFRSPQKKTLHTNSGEFFIGNGRSRSRVLRGGLACLEYLYMAATTQPTRTIWYGHRDSSAKEGWARSLNSSISVLIQV